MANNPNIVVTASDRASAALNNVARSVDGISAPVLRLSSAFATLAGSVGVSLFVNSIRNMVGVLDDLDEAAQTVGVTAVALAEMRLAASESGVNADKLGVALAKLNVKMEDASTGGKESAAAFRALGINVKDASGNLKSTDAVLGEVANQFKNFRDGAEKTALAVALFGKAGAAMIPFLNGGSESLRKFAGVTEESVRESKKLQQEFDKLAESAEVLKQKIAAGVVPAINDMIKAVQRVDFAAAAKKVLPGLIIRDLMQQRDAALHAVRGDRAVRSLTDAVDRYGDSLKAAAPKVGDFVAKVKKTEEISAARQALAQYVEGLERQLTTLQKVTEKEQALRFLRANPGIDTPQVRQLVAALADQVDKLEEEKLVREHLLRIAKEQREAEKAIRDAKEKDAVEEFRILAENNRTLRELTGQADQDRIAGLQGILDKAIEMGEVTEAQALRAQRSINELKLQTNETALAMAELGAIGADALGDLIKNPGDFKSIFKRLEEQVIDLITQLLIVEPIIKSIRSAAGGATTSGGGFDFGAFIGSIIGSFDVGTDYVPKTGLALVHKGEAIIPEHENRAGKGGGVVIYQTFAPDTTRRTINQAAEQAGQVLRQAQRRNS